MERQTRAMHRRTFLATTGLGVAAVGLPRRVAAAEMNEAEKANLKVINRFLHIRWNATPIDWNEVGQILAEDCVWGTNTTNFTKGREAILKVLKQNFGDGVPTRHCHVVQQWANGSIVTNERYEGTGVGQNGGPPSVAHGVGVFQVKDGKIKEWRWFGIENGPGLKAPASAFKP